MYFSQLQCLVTNVATTVIKSIIYLFTQCVTELKLKEKFDHVAEELGLTDTNGSSCYQHANVSNNVTHTNSCLLVYSVCRDLMLETELTTEACLAGNTSSSGHSRNQGDYISGSDGKLHICCQ